MREESVLITATKQCTKMMDTLGVITNSWSYYWSVHIHGYSDRDYWLFGLFKYLKLIMIV